MYWNSVLRPAAHHCVPSKPLLVVMCTASLSTPKDLPKNFTFKHLKYCCSEDYFRVNSMSDIYVFVFKSQCTFTHCGTTTMKLDNAQLGVSDPGIWHLGLILVLIDVDQKLGEVITGWGSRGVKAITKQNTGAMGGKQGEEQTPNYKQKVVATQKPKSSLNRKPEGRALKRPKTLLTILQAHIGGGQRPDCPPNCRSLELI